MFRSYHLIAALVILAACNNVDEHLKSRDTSKHSNVNSHVLDPEIEQLLTETSASNVTTSQYNAECRGYGVEVPFSTPDNPEQCLQSNGAPRTSRGWVCRGKIPATDFLLNTVGGDGTLWTYEIQNSICFLLSRDNPQQPSKVKGVLCFNTKSCKACALNHKTNAQNKQETNTALYQNPQTLAPLDRCSICHRDGTLFPSTHMFNAMGALEGKIQDLQRTCSVKGGPDWIVPKGMAGKSGWGPYGEAHKVKSPSACSENGCHANFVKDDDTVGVNYCDVILHAIGQNGNSDAPMKDHFADIDPVECQVWKTQMNCPLIKCPKVSQAPVSQICNPPVISNVTLTSDSAQIQWTGAIDKSSEFAIWISNASGGLVDGRQKRVSGSYGVKGSTREQGSTQVPFQFLPGVQYKVQVLEVSNNKTCSKWSAPVSRSLAGASCSAKPTAPSGLVANLVSEKVARVKWNNPNNLPWVLFVAEYPAASSTSGKGIIDGRSAENYGGSSGFSGSETAISYPFKKGAKYKFEIRFGEKAERAACNSTWARPIYLTIPTQAAPVSTPAPMAPSIPPGARLFLMEPNGNFKGCTLIPLGGAIGSNVPNCASAIAQDLCNSGGDYRSCWQE